MMRSVILWGTLFLVLGTVNGLILAKERTLAEGTSMLLPLAAGDAHSIRGGKMALRYRLARHLSPSSRERSGYLVVVLDGSGVATFRRFYMGRELLSNEHLLFYRNRGGLQLGAESFSPGGKGELYAEARFAEFKVDRKGRSVLVGLRNEDLRPLCD